MASIDLARAFFVWLSVFNLFVVSIFLSFMADIFSPGQAQRELADIDKKSAALARELTELARKRAGLEAMGLHYVPKHTLTTLNAVHVPDGVDAEADLLGRGRGIKGLDLIDQIFSVSGPPSQ